MSSSPDKKVWTWQGSFQDHVRFLIHLPFFFVAPIALPPKAVESVHLSVNSVMRCPFCTGLHCEIGRMAGLEDVATVNECAKLSASDEAEFGIFSDYGKSFGTHNGRGAEVDGLYEQIREEKGAIAARSAQGLAFFLLWGSMGGNTLISFYRGTLRGEMKEGSNLVFEICFALYYSLVFGIITATSKLLSFLPSNVPVYVNMIIGLVLPLVASIWIIPYAIIGLVLNLSSVILKDNQYDPLGGQYQMIV
jgi:AhpD family alkylhydroperoxidase